MWTITKADLVNQIRGNHCVVHTYSVGSIATTSGIMALHTETSDSTDEGNRLERLVGRLNTATVPNILAVNYHMLVPYGSGAGYLHLFEGVGIAGDSAPIQTIVRFAATMKEGAMAQECTVEVSK